MSAAYYLELLNDEGNVLERHAYTALPITVGRAYDNALVLDDPYVAAHHAVIDQSSDGDVSIRDLGSRNGVICDGQRHAELNIASINIAANITVRLGRTHIRIRSADFVVADELLLDEAPAPKLSSNLHSAAGGWKQALVALAIIILLSISSVWITDTEQFSAIRYFMATALILGVVLLWCGCWAFANRVFGSHARFSRHLFIVACGLLVMDAWDIFSVTAAYAFSIEVLTRYSEHVVMLISAGIIFFHLRTINPERPRRFAVLCAILAVLGSGLILMNNYQRYGRLADDLYMTYILPPQVRLSPDQPIAQFMQDAGGLKAKVDEDRLKPVNDNLMLMEDEEAPAAESFPQ